MNDINKCCKTCKWSVSLDKTSEHIVKTGKNRLQCNWELRNKIPDSIPTIVAQEFMYEDEGHHCPCWEIKE